MTDDKSEYINQIFLNNSDGTGKRQLTTSDKNNIGPKWSPDGNRIAFVSNRDGKYNLYLLAAAGGVPEKITDVKTRINEFSWSPDGKMIAFTMNDAPEIAQEKARKEKNDWYFMGEVHSTVRLHVLWLFEKDSSGSGKQQTLTPANRSVRGFDWCPDNTSIAYDHVKTPVAADWLTSEISIVNIYSRIKKDIVVNKNIASIAPLYSPDGRYIAYCQTRDSGSWAGPISINYILRPEGHQLIWQIHLIKMMNC